MTSSKNLFEACEQWANRPADQRFQTLDQLTAAVSARRMRSRSQDADLTTVEVSANGDGVFVNGTTTKATPSHYAFGQLATALKAPAGYLRTLPAPLAAQNLMHGIKTADKSALKFMSVENEDGEGGRVLHAVTSPTYGRIWDADVAAAAGRIVERSGGKFHNPFAYAKGHYGSRAHAVPSGLYASDRDIFIFMIDGGSLLEAGNRAQLNRGFFLKNSEVGAATFTLTTFLFNMVCGNHIVWGAQDVNQLVIRHTKNGPYRFDSEAAPALLAYANASAKPVEDAVRRAMAYDLRKEWMIEPKEFGADSVSTMAALKASAKFTKTEIKEAIAFAEREEGQCASLWDLCQGLTAYARGFDYIDARVDLETRAGKLLSLVKE